MPIKLGIVGTNFISDRLWHAVQYVPEVEVCAVYSRHQETGDAFAAKYGITQVYTDYEFLHLPSHIQSDCQYKWLPILYLIQPNHNVPKKQSLLYSVLISSSLMLGILDCSIFQQDFCGCLFPYTRKSRNIICCISH